MSVVSKNRVRSRVRSGVASCGVAVVWGLLAGVLAAQDWQPVLAQLTDGKSARRIDALRQLNQAGYGDAAAAVAPLVTDGDDAVQLAAIDAELTFFLGEPVAEQKGISGTRSRAQVAFDAGPLLRGARPAPPVVIDRLLTATADSNARVRFDALHALGAIAEPPLSPTEARRLASGLSHGDAIVRTATARVLGRVRALDAGDALIMALNDSNDMVQQYAMEALGLIKNDRAVQALTDRVTFHGSSPMGDTALLALARIGHGSSRDLFRARLGDPSAGARRAAVEGLGRLRDRASLDRVRAIASTDASNDVRLAGLFALDRLGEPQLDGIASAVTHPTVGEQARGYLLETGPAASPVVIAAMTKAANAPLRAELIRVLGVIGGYADARVVEPFLKDPDAAVARAAANAVAKLRR